MLIATVVPKVFIQNPEEDAIITQGDIVNGSLWFELVDLKGFPLSEVF